MALAGRVIVITGASSGIGEELARQAVNQGACVVLAARSTEKLAGIAAGLGETALAVPTDVTKREDHAHLLQQSIERFGRVDVWVNNAGRGISKSIFDVTDEDFDEMMLMNTKSVLYAMQAVVPYFKQQGKGHLINVSSLLGRIPYVTFRSAYCAAKHALNSITGSARLELRQQGFKSINVSLILPGVVATDFGINAMGGGPDSRSLPGAQPVAEVADVIIDVIKSPRADEYTRPSYREWMASYFSAERVEDVEAQPPFPQPVSP